MFCPAILLMRLPEQSTKAADCASGLSERNTIPHRQCLFPKRSSRFSSSFYRTSKVCIFTWKCSPEHAVQHIAHPQSFSHSRVLPAYWVHPTDQEWPSGCHAAVGLPSPALISAHPASSFSLPLSHLKTYPSPLECWCLPGTSPQSHFLSPSSSTSQAPQDLAWNLLRLFTLRGTTGSHQKRTKPACCRSEALHKVQGQQNQTSTEISNCNAS